MKNKERIIWISLVAVLMTALLSGVFINKASAGTVKSGFPHIQKLLSVFYKIKSDFVDEAAIDDKKLINGAIKGMLESLGDPHTVYLSVEDMDDLNQTSDGKFGGVGMIISEKDDYITVVTPIEDTPAFRKGMKTGDLLITVDGKSLKGVKVGEAAKMLKGVPGTSVKVEFIRNEMKYEVEFVRAVIDVPTVKHSYIKDKYGYLRITQFAGTTDEHVKKVLQEFKEKKVEAIIVDLRYNPGGLLSQVENIVDFFQNDGVIVSTKARRAVDSQVRYASKARTIVPDEVPVIVLIDQGSASASEIFSGAIKDTSRGILIGEKSYGKGSVQSIIPLGEDGFKITMAKYYTPSGISIDKIGIVPDIEIKEPDLTDPEKEALKNIYNDKVIEQYTKKNPKPTLDQINSFIRELQNNPKYKLQERQLRRLIKNALDVYDENKSIYDLEYDIQLLKAVEVLDKKNMEYKNGKFLLKK